jgi:hypothetical protein
VYTDKCGSELARDEALSVSGHVACNAAIASKLAPTGIEHICQSQIGRKASSRFDVDRSHAPRGNASRDAPRHPCARLKPGVDSGTQSVPGGIPTRSVGTIRTRKR